MTSKRPKDMTIEELEALPDGPIEFDDILIDTKEKAAKYRLPLGITIRRPHMRRAAASAVRPDDIAVAHLSNGAYSFGQFEDGSWYKHRI